jgi:hypothetical protein
VSHGKKGDKEAATFFLCLLYFAERCVWRTYGNQEKKKIIRLKNSLKIYEFNQIYRYLMNRSIKIGKNIEETRK